MGNNSSTTNDLRLSNIGDRPYQVVLEESVVLHFTGRKFLELSTFTSELWELSYKVHDNSTCRIILSKDKQTNSPYDVKLAIYIADDAFGLSSHRFIVNVSIQDAEAGLLTSAMQKLLIPSLLQSYRETGIEVGTIMCVSKVIEPCFTSSSSSTNNAIETRFYFNGSGTRSCLIIWEEKKIKRSSDDNELKPYTATMTHYYANTENGKNIGVSVAVKKIRVVNRDINFDIDGPEQHPASDLLYMFDKVRRTKTWKSIYCPHCAYKAIERHRRAGMWQSESESDADNNYVPIHGGRRSPGSLVSISGRISGGEIGTTHIGRCIPRRTQ